MEHVILDVSSIVIADDGYLKRMTNEEKNKEVRIIDKFGKLSTPISVFELGWNQETMEVEFATFEIDKLNILQMCGVLTVNCFEFPNKESAKEYVELL